jgi:hypothetical protein
LVCYLQQWGDIEPWPSGLTTLHILPILITTKALQVCGEDTPLERSGGLPVAITATFGTYPDLAQQLEPILLLKPKTAHDQVRG